MSGAFSPETQPEPRRSRFGPPSTWSWARLIILLLAILVEGSLLVLAILIGDWLGIPLGFRLMGQPIDLAYGVLATGPMMLLLVVCLKSTWGPMGELREAVGQGVEPIARHCTMSDLLLIAALAGLGEEAIFRGIMQPALSDRHGPLIALLLTSLAFGLLHPITWLYIIFASLIGLYLGLITQWSGNIVAATVAHGLYDLIALALLVQRVRQSPVINDQEQRSS